MFTISTGCAFPFAPSPPILKQAKKWCCAAAVLPMRFVPAWLFPEFSLRWKSTASAWWMADSPAIFRLRPCARWGQTLLSPWMCGPNLKAAKLSIPPWRHQPDARHPDPARNTRSNSHAGRARCLYSSGIARGRLRRLCRIWCQCCGWLRENDSTIERAAGPWSFSATICKLLCHQRMPRESGVRISFLELKGASGPVRRSLDQEIGFAPGNGSSFGSCKNS